MSKVIVIGSGFAGLTAAITLADEGYDVTILEKNDTVGGRARQVEIENFTFDMGPSWYWMPDVFETFFRRFGHAASDYYNLKRLDPSYRVFFGANDTMDLPADINELILMFEEIEEGSGDALVNFLNKPNISMMLESMIWSTSREDP